MVLLGIITILCQFGLASSWDRSSSLNSSNINGIQKNLTSKNNIANGNACSDVDGCMECVEVDNKSVCVQCIVPLWQWNGQCTAECPVEISFEKDAENRICGRECEIVSVRNVGGGPPAYPNASSALYAGFYYLVQEKSQDHPRYQHADPQSGAYLTYSTANLGGHSDNRWQFFGLDPVCALGYNLPISECHVQNGKNVTAVPIGGWTVGSQADVIRPTMCASDSMCQWSMLTCASSAVCTARKWAPKINKGMIVTCAKYVQSADPVDPTTSSSAPTILPGGLLPRPGLYLIIGGSVLGLTLFVVIFVAVYTRVARKSIIRQISSSAAAPLLDAQARGSPDADAAADWDLDSDEEDKWIIPFDQLGISWNQRLGTGANAHVYRGSFNGMKVAVKELGQQDVHYEAKLLSSLAHPNIVHLYGTSFQNGKCYMVMELCHHSTADLLNAGRVTWHRRQQFLQIAQQVAEGMAFMHFKGILHRDLKPPNVLLKGHEVKIADFGLSRKEQDSLSRDMTLEIGTPAYMAPELFVTDDNLSPGPARSGDVCGRKVDVYAFGILLWCLHNGKRAYDDLNTYQIMYRVKMKGQRPPIADTCSSAVRELLTTCWHENPQSRPSFEKIQRELVTIRKRGDWQSSKGPAARSKTVSATKQSNQSRAQPAVSRSAPVQRSSSSFADGGAEDLPSVV